METPWMAGKDPQNTGELRRVPLLAKLRKASGSNKITAYHAMELSVLNSPEVDEHLSRIWGKVNDTPQDVAAKIEKLDAFYTQAPLWAFKMKEGKSHSQSLCSTCHQTNTNDVLLGPDLTGSGENGARYFLENIIDPNAVVGSDYASTIVETHSGQSVSGMIENENDTAVSIQTLTNLVTLPRTDKRLPEWHNP
jgi:putative heme-binding domain-containing protein